MATKSRTAENFFFALAIALLVVAMLSVTQVARADDSCYSDCVANCAPGDVTCQMKCWYDCQQAQVKTCDSTTDCDRGNICVTQNGDCDGLHKYCDANKNGKKCDDCVCKLLPGYADCACRRP